MAPAAARPTDEQLSPKDSRDALNDQSFVPFKIVAREDVSPNAFVLTVRLASKTDPDKEPSKASRKLTRQRMDEAWRHGLWSVEVKQPQLQIARDYTPLPEVDGTYADGDGDGDGDTHMRLFVRVVPGGEVSRYLSRLAVGSRIGLRGPRRSFDVVARLGESGKKTNGHSQQSELSEFRDDSAPVPDPETEEPKKMVVLAGGTGVATALQAADAALRALPTVSVTVLWANRLPYDGAGLKAEANLGANNTNNTRNPIVRDIRALQARYGADRLQVQSFVDAENTRITEADVRKAIGAKEPETSWFRPWRKEPQRLTSTMPTEEVDRWAEVHRENAACAYHSYSLLVRRSSDPWRNPNSPTPACSCREAKDLILVSGPEGFIEAWAGPKTWMSGKERQGTVDGILRRMAVQDPQTFSKWQVLKL
ncbi:mitochondrial peripheral inner membrane protein [Sporothrix curviconia]|uniref:Mitochondrial peripheral inner membrane protein n=1 Tax=Sporothrix curviconia TaxID=1260050 RepID=A0ABP0BXK2_9PEZI